MPLSRLITLIVGIVLVLGLMLWLVDSLYQIYSLLLRTLLAKPMLLLLIVLLVVLRRGCLLCADDSGCREAIAAAAAVRRQPQVPEAKPKRQKKRCELCGNRWSRFRMKCRGKLY